MLELFLDLHRALEAGQVPPSAYLRSRLQRSGSIQPHSARRMARIQYHSGPTSAAGDHQELNMNSGQPITIAQFVRVVRGTAATNSSPS